jgi:redox-sensitive bicupin YhaK (pirin superfamily)
MEIVTLVLSGSLTHKDSMNSEETLSRGSVQYMSAGRGVRHSEYNGSKENPVRFIQMWLVPRSQGLTPNYGSMRDDGVRAELRYNRFDHLVSDTKSPHDVPIRINTDTNMFLSEFDTELKFEIGAKRQAYVVSLENQTQVGDVLLKQHEALRVIGPAQLHFAPKTENAKSLVLIVEMAQQ